MLLLPFSADEIYYYVSDVSGTRGVTSDLQAVSAYNDDGSLLTELTVEGIAHGNGDRTILVGYMTVDDFSDEQTVESDVFIIPPVLSLLPPMVIIIFAVATKSVLLSLAGKYMVIDYPPFFVRDEFTMNVFLFQLGFTLPLSSCISITFSKHCTSPECCTS